MPTLIALVTFALVILALVDIIARPDDKVNHLPKLVWVVLVVLLPVIGSIVWFAVGRDWTSTTRPVRTPSPMHPSVAHRPPVSRDPRSTEEQLAELEREIEDYERIRELEAKLEERRKRDAMD